MVEPCDFDNLVLPTKPNWYFTAPVLDMSAESLLQTILSVMEARPRMQQLLVNQQTGQLEYVARSRLFHFPDFISIKVTAMSSEQSSLTIYSRAKYGYSDLGVNKKRVLRILNDLSA